MTERRQAATATGNQTPSTACPADNLYKMEPLPISKVNRNHDN